MLRNLGLARALRTLLDLMLVLGLLATAVVVVWVVVATLLMAGGDRAADASVRVSVGRSTLLPVVDVTASAPDDAIRSMHLVKARGELRFETSDWLVHLASNGALVVASLLSLVGVFLLREMLRTAIAGEPFAPANVRRLRQLALLLVAGGVIVPLLEYATSLLVLGRVRVDAPPLGPAPPVDLGPVLAGLFLFVLSAVFEHGAALEDDRSLTV